MKKIRNLILVLLFAFVLVSCKEKAKEESPKLEKAVVYQESKTEKTEDNKKNLDTEKTEKLDQTEKKKDKKENKTVKLRILGDIFFHQPILDYALSKGAEAYDFKDNFAHLKDFTSEADLAILNNEFTVNPNMEPSEYPSFNTPKEIYKAFVDMGIDLVTTANNHCLDTGIQGLETTLDALSEFGIKNVGTQRAWEENGLIYKVKGINIGVLSYTQFFNGLESQLETDEDWSRVNPLDLEKIRTDIARLKDMGADFILIMPHWGIEYELHPNDYQISLARSMVEAGADMVIASHPHVVQPVEEYTAEDGRRGIIAYSLGNTLCDQREETRGNVRMEQGLAMEIDLEKKDSGEKIIKSYKAEPLWLDGIDTENGSLVQAYVASDYIKGGKNHGKLDEDKSRQVQEAYDMTMEIVNNIVE